MAAAVLLLSTKHRLGYVMKVGNTNTVQNRRTVIVSSKVLGDMFVPEFLSALI